MAIDDKIKEEKLQYNIKREASNLSALLSGKPDKYEYRMGEEILPSNQTQITLREKCPNTKFFLVCIFLYSYWIRNIRI